MRFDSVRFPIHDKPFFFVCLEEREINYSFQTCTVFYAPEERHLLTNETRVAQTTPEFGRRFDLLLQEIPLALRSWDIRRYSQAALKNLLPSHRFRTPRELFSEIVPPDAVTCRRIVDPRRSQFRFNLNPFFSARRFADFFLRRERARRHYLYDRSSLLPREVDPAGFELESA